MPYRIEYAKSGRAVCQNGECKKRGSKIPKGGLRLGVWLEIQGNGTYKWRHYGCITDRVMKNMHAEFGSDALKLLDGMEDLQKEDQDRVAHAIEIAAIEPEDYTTWEPIVCDDGWVEEPKDLNRPAGSPAKAPTKKRKTAKEDDTDGDIAPLVDSDEESPKPKKAKKSTTPRKKTKKQLAAEEKQEAADAALDDENEPDKKTSKSVAKSEPKEEPEDEPIEVKLASDEEEKPAVKTQKKTKKAPARSRKQASKKPSSDSDAESGTHATVEKRRAPKRGAQKQAVQETTSDDSEH